MDTLKTGFIVVLLLAVLYGVYVVLNKDQTPPSAEIAWHQQQVDQDLQIDISTGADSQRPEDPSGKGAGEPGLLKTPSSDSTKATAGGFTTPSATAELSPPSAEPAPTTPHASNPTQSDSLPTGLNPSPQPVSPPASRADVGVAEVAAPSLLPSQSAEPKPTENDNGATAGRSSDLTSLPALREPPPSAPASTAPSTNSPAETSVPPNPAVENPPAVANQLPPLATVPDAVPAASPTEPIADVPDPAAPNTTPEPILKPVSTAVALEAAMREAQSNLAAEQWYQALFLLSKFYGSADLAPQQERELIDMLDPLAAKVVYSQEHLVADAHEVRRGDTLAQIAAANQVPPELLSNINGIENPDLLVPGTKLKIVRGPFRADIRLEKKELTLFAGQLYAGRFPISVGQDPLPQPGEYRVLDKQPGHDFYAKTGQRMAADDPQNPFGKVWIGLDKELAIHGTPERGESGNLGCISLSPLDAADVYGILTQGSSVTIRP